MQTLSNVIITYTKMEVRCLCLEICVYGWSPLPKHIFIYFNIFFLLYKKVAFFNCFELCIAVYSYDAFPDHWNIPLLAMCTVQITHLCEKAGNNLWDLKRQLLFKFSTFPKLKWHRSSNFGHIAQYCILHKLLSTTMSSLYFLLLN